jgi:hypothetical protein
MAWKLNPTTKKWDWTGGGKPDLATKPADVPTFLPKGSTKKPPAYIWTIDAKGKVVKMEATVAKKSFATLPESAQSALAQQLMNTNVMPTTTSLKSLWDKIVDGAASEYKAGKKSTPWDVLKILAKNTPVNTGITSTIFKDYNPVIANAYLNNVAATIGFDVNQLSDADKSDFAAKMKEAASEFGKQTTKVINPLTGESETTMTPDLFDPKTFAENWLWAKVNIGDPSKLPTTAITALTSVKKILRNNGIDELSPMEVNKLAVNLASGKVNAASLQAEYSKKAAMNYPLLADRLLANPEASVMDLLNPAVNAIAKWLEIDPNSVDLTNKYLDAYARPDGASGKVPMPSMADFITSLKNSPDAEKTTWANEAARGAATGLARAMGFGI